MRTSNYDYPHPVLFIGNDDYVDSKFSISIDSYDDKSNTEFALIINYSLKSQGLTKLIDTGKAIVVLRIESPAASYRKKYEFLENEKTKTIKISKKSVAEKLIIKGFIVASENIDNFLLPKEHNPDYFSNPFKINKGEILAYEPGSQLYLDASELERPVSSIITVAKNSFNSEPIHISLDNNKIEIFLNENSYNTYWNLRRKHDLKKYLVGLIVYPAVMEATEKIKRTIDETGNPTEDIYSEKTWYRVIVHKLKEYGIYDDISISTSSTLANKLLGNVVNSSLESLNETFENEFDGSNTDVMGGND